MPQDDQDRLACAAHFAAALFDDSRSSPKAWRRANAVGRTIGIEGQRLEQAIIDAASAGLVDRSVEDADLVLLTSRGRAVAEGKG
jgi:hypothetical protein